MPIRPGEKHHTTAVFLISDETPTRVLLLKHKKLGMWLPPGGHVDQDEVPYNGGIREVLEETGIDIRPFIEQPIRLDERTISYPAAKYFLEEPIPAHKDDPAHFHLDHVFVYRIPHHPPVLNDESDQIGWFDLAEALELPTFVNVHFLITQIIG